MPLDENGNGTAFACEFALGAEIGANELGKFLALRRVGGDDHCPRRLRGVVESHGSQAVAGIGVLADPALLAEQLGGIERLFGFEKPGHLPHFRRAAWLLAEIDRGGLADLGRKPLGQRGRVVGIDPRVVRSPGDGHIGEPGVDQAARRFGVDVGKNPACRDPL